MKMNEYESVVDSFLSTLDSFKITSDRQDDINYLPTDALLDYWLKSGIECEDY